MIEKYVKKPIIVEAIQFTKDNVKEVEKWLSKNDIALLTLNGDYYMQHRYKPIHLDLHFGDYIIQGIDKSIYPCSKDTFNKTYEKVSNIQQSNKIGW